MHLDKLSKMQILVQKHRVIVNTIPHTYVIISSSILAIRVELARMLEGKALCHSIICLIRLLDTSTIHCVVVNFPGFLLLLILLVSYSLLGPGF